MLFTPVFKAALLLSFLNVSSLAFNIKDCNFPCDESDQSPVCVLNKNEICFRILPSKCHMDRMNCKQIVYEIYIDSYCELDAFKCNDQPIFQYPPIYNDLLTSDESGPNEVEFTNAEDYETQNEVD